MNAPASKTNRSGTKQLLLIFLIAFLVRVGFTASTVRKHEHERPNQIDTLQYDDEQYWAIGRSYRRRRHGG
ncbi:MAG: hypothetical protein R3E58_03650 [Phycisphaerae bacterium]